MTAPATSWNFALQPETRFGLTAAEWQVIALALGIHGMSNGLLPARYHVPANLAAAAAASAPRNAALDGHRRAKSR